MSIIKKKHRFGGYELPKIVRTVQKHTYGRNI